MDAEFRTDAHNGLSQLDSLFSQVRAEVMAGRHCNVLVTKAGRTTTIKIEAIMPPMGTVEPEKTKPNKPEKPVRTVIRGGIDELSEAEK